MYSYQYVLEFYDMDPKINQVARNISECCEYKWMNASSFPLFLLGCAPVSAGFIPHLGKSPALEGRCSSTHHTLWWGSAADSDPNGARAPPSLTQDLCEKPTSFCEEVSARPLVWPCSLTSSLWCHSFSFVCRLGILTVRHMKRLERVILGYLEVYDGPEEEARLKILETLKLLMQYTWPRYNSQADRCAKKGKTQPLFSLELAQVYMQYKVLSAWHIFQYLPFYTPIGFWTEKMAFKRYSTPSVVSVCISLDL